MSHRGKDLAKVAQGLSLVLRKLGSSQVGEAAAKAQGFARHGQEIGASVTHVARQVAGRAGGAAAGGISFPGANGGAAAAAGGEGRSSEGFSGGGEGRGEGGEAVAENTTASSSSRASSTHEVSPAASFQPNEQGFPSQAPPPLVASLEEEQDKAEGTAYRTRLENSSGREQERQAPQNNREQQQPRAVDPIARGSSSSWASSSSPDDEEASDSATPQRSSRARAVPSSPLARVFGFGSLAAGLAVGTVAEAMRRGMGSGSSSGQGPDGLRGSSEAGQGGGGGGMKKYVMSDANAERLAESLCRMRGAALKLGQMLSIQDESVIPPQLAKALERVRAGADMMPPRQLHNQLAKNLGEDWRSKLQDFEETPLAAASIGQVHRATLLDGRLVAMKVQYPGVADSIGSDLRNLERLITLTDIMPPGLFVDEIVEVARLELSEECDYETEAEHQTRFRALVQGDPVLAEWISVPDVVPSLGTKQVLTSEFVSGITVDKVAGMSQDVRNHVARLVLRVTMNELFTWRFMQTDPNWGNFLFDPNTGKLHLIDFGACRSYGRSFVDKYQTLVWSAANRDCATLLSISEELGFLTGDESPDMLKAHEQAGLVVGEPFVKNEPFDFFGSEITNRIGRYGDTFMKHRLTPPPREAYSLHRKLAGAFLMCIKLKANIRCRDILEDVYEANKTAVREEMDQLVIQRQQQKQETVAASALPPAGVLRVNA